MHLFWPFWPQNHDKNLSTYDHAKNRHAGRKRQLKFINVTGWSTFVHCLYCDRGVVSGGAWGAMAPPDFGRSVNPISTKGVRLCPPNNTGTPEIFRPSDGPDV